VEAWRKMSSSTTTTFETTGVTTSLATGVQYGFFFDQSRCVSCTSCMTVCKSWNMIPPGPVKLLHLFEYEQGAFPNVQTIIQWVPCYHCMNPVCIPASNGAMFKEPKYGAVLIDPTQANSPSMRAAWAACPYGAIAFDSDSATATASKCTMCIDRLEQGDLPACVMACPMRALDFDTIDNLRTKYGTNQQLKDLPDPSIADPAVVFKPLDTPKQIVDYDPTEALALLGSRGSLPAIYTDPSQVTTLSPGQVSRSSLNLKPSSVEDLQAATMNDGA
jgi:anaerobic dimethyl sulfoxide reductase subunit B